MYFEKSGKENTQAVSNCIAEYIQTNKIKYLVIASVSGYTAESFVERFSKRMNIVVVTHVVGMVDNNLDEMSIESRSKLLSQNAKIITAAHAFAGVERAVSSCFGGVYPMELIGNSLKMLGAGLKVCVECASMAMDNGAIPHGQDIIAVGGTVRGADTAIVMRPAYSAKIFETQIREIICKPKQFVSQIKASD